MNGKSSCPQEKNSLRTLFLPSLFISNFCIGLLGVLTGLLLVDMALTFNVPVGVMGQNNTLSYVVAVVFAVLSGALCVRFSYKSLMIIGLICFGVATLGVHFAPEFNSMLLSYSLTGVATAMVFPMTVALIGEYVPLEKRTSAVGWIIAAGSLSFLFGAPMIGFFAGVMSWRSIIAVFIMPVSLASLVLAFVGVPSAPRLDSEVAQPSLREVFGKVLANTSAAACLVGNFLHTAGFMAIAFYGVSFFRQSFLVPVDLASVIVLAAASCYTVGSLLAGRLVGKFQRKSLIVLADLLLGILTVSFLIVPNLWVSLTLNFFGAFFSGIESSAANSMTLEQVPQFRGTMTSINSAAISLGNALGAAIGGAILVLINYNAVGIALGGMAIAAALIFSALADDPCPPKP